MADSAEAAASTTTPIVYFGFGANVNPISLKKRKVHAVNSRPAVLKGYRLSFDVKGVGNVIRDESTSVHGIVMEIPNLEDWECIKKIEMGYDLVEEPVYPYNEESPVQAQLFIFSDKKVQEFQNEKSKPTERYIQIITSGLRGWGVEEEYIENNVANVEFIPKRKGDDRYKFPYAVQEGELPKITYSQYQELDKPVCIIDNRVIEIIYPNEESKKNPAINSMAERFIKQPCRTFFMTQVLYDPDLPNVETPKDVQEVHHAWAEDSFVEFFNKMGLKGQVIYELINEGDEE